MNDMYWAADPDTETVVNKISGFLNSFSLNTESERSSISSIWTRNLRMYYQSVVNNDSVDSSLSEGGENGELIGMHVPVARSDVRKLISIATRQRLNFKAQAESTDYLTKGSAVVADALSQEYNLQFDFNGLREKSLELSIVTGSSFILTEWDAAKQKPVFRVIPCWMTTYNFNAESFAHLDWFVVHYFANRYTLAEQYPDFRDEIINFKTDRTAINPWSINFGVLDYSDDDILISTFYHKGTEALPQGRYIKFIGDIGLEDMENPFKDREGVAEIPVSMVMPESIQPYLIGYPKICDLLPLQEMTDHQFSVMASIFANLATPAILNPRGSGMNASNMSGFKVISFSPQMGDGMRGMKPEILELCKLPPNLLDTINLMQQFQQRISNVNGALQGILPPGVTAASAIATLSANAVEFIEPLSLAVNKAMEETMMRALIQTSLFMTEERVVESVGPSDTTATIQFKAEDLRGLKRINLLIQNPLAMFAGGRQKIAEDYMKMGIVDSPEKYDSVMVYGSVKPIQEKRMTKESLVSWENQELRGGRPVRALAGDDHAYHIAEHYLMCNDPEIRKRPEIIRMIDDHVQMHLDLSRTVDVGLYAMIQTGKNLPPDQNTPTGLPEQQAVPPSGPVGEQASPTPVPNPEGNVAEPANPAQPGFDIGEANAAL